MHTILVVDDEPELRMLAQAMLDDLGYASLLAGSGDAAIEILLKDPPAVAAVLLDMNMPGLRPEETFSRLRITRPDLPVIILSGCSQSIVSQRFAPGTIAGSIQKPYSEMELEAALTRTLAPPAQKAAPTFALSPLSEMDMRELAEEYLAARRRELPIMAELLAHADFARLGAISHSLKGSGGCYGFSELTRLGGVLERFANASDAASFGEQLAFLKDHLEHLSNTRMH